MPKLILKNLEILARRFEADGDVEEAFRLVFLILYYILQHITKLLNRLVRESGGLEETRNLAKKHAGQAVEALSRYLLQIQELFFSGIGHEM